MPVSGVALFLKNLRASGLLDDDQLRRGWADGVGADGVASLIFNLGPRMGSHL